MTIVSYVRKTSVENENKPDSNYTGQGESEGGGGGRSRGEGMQLGSLYSSSGANSIFGQTHTHARRAHHGAGTLNTDKVRTFKVSHNQFT